jgi:hypothetical protein
MLDLLREISLGNDSWCHYRTLLIPNPLAGADFKLTVPGGKCYLPLAVTATLTTGVAVASRTPALILGDGSVTIAAIPADETLAASLAVVVSWLIGGASVATPAAPTVQGAILPPLPLPAGFTLASLTGGIQAADQWSGVTVWVLETDKEDLAVRWQYPSAQYGEGYNPSPPRGSNTSAYRTGA